jgi:hypothetical protein
VMGDEYLSKSTPWILMDDEGMGIEGLRTATAAAAASFDFSFSLFESGGRLECVDGIPFSIVGGGKSLRFATQRRKKFEKSQATELQNQGTSGGTAGFTPCWTRECTIFKMITLPSYL